MSNLTSTTAATDADAGTAGEPKVVARYNHDSPANVAFRAQRPAASTAPQCSSGAC